METTESYPMYGHLFSNRSTIITTVVLTWQQCLNPSQLFIQSHSMSSNTYTDNKANKAGCAHI
jgi:hypothetical protein